MVLAALMAAAPAEESQWNCENPGPQQEMNWCATRDFEKADAALNEQWKKTVVAMKQRDTGWDASFDDRPGFFDMLLEAQRAWLKYRDAHCASEGYIFRGGSMEPFMVSTCKKKLTEERTRQLKDLLEQ
jgi:uncharacterized protein YecT (DUF1311 family)